MLAVSSPVGRDMKQRRSGHDNEESIRKGTRSRVDGKAQLTQLVLHYGSSSEHLLKILPSLDGEVMAVRVDPLLSTEESSEVESSSNREEGDPVWRERRKKKVRETRRTTKMEL